MRMVTLPTAEPQSHFTETTQQSSRWLITRTLIVRLCACAVVCLGMTDWASPRVHLLWTDFETRLLFSQLQFCTFLCCVCSQRRAFIELVIRSHEWRFVSPDVSRNAFNAFFRDGWLLQSSSLMNCTKRLAGVICLTQSDESFIEWTRWIRQSGYLITIWLSNCKSVLFLKYDTLFY